MDPIQFLWVFYVFKKCQSYKQLCHFECSSIFKVWHALTEYISVIFLTIFKNYMRFQKVFTFPFIIVLNQLCNFIRLEIISKTVEHSSFRINDNAQKMISCNMNSFAFLLLTSKVFELQTWFKKQMKGNSKTFWNLT